jgi:predicted RNA-binding Zn-ribbon protein involved in translation (DUF1610 family)
MPKTVEAVDGNGHVPAHARGSTSAGRWPCPLCGLLLLHGGHHFVRVHGLTAAEVRKLTGQRTVHPETARHIGAEIGERTGQRRWTDGEILAAIRHHYAVTGNAPSSKAWRKAAKYHPSNSLILRRFGTWNAALDAAGVPRRRRKTYRPTKEHRAAMNAGLHRAELVEKTCPMCGKAFERVPSRAHEEACSLSCRTKLRYARNPKPKVLATCPNCGKTFEPRPTHPEQRHCSQSCAAVVNNLRRGRMTTDGPCLADGCDEPRVARGLCDRHYRAARRIVGSHRVGH